MVSAAENSGSLDARGALGLWAASRRLIWPLLLEPPAWALCAGSCVACLADPARGATSGPRATQGRWGEAVWVFDPALPAAGTRWWLGRPPPCRLRATCQAFSSWGRWSPLPELWGCRGEGRLPVRLKAGPLWWPSSPVPFPTPPAPALAQLIDVVWSCSPGPGLSRAGRGTGVPSERVRSSRSVRGSPRLSFPLAPWGG